MFDYQYPPNWDEIKSLVKKRDRYTCQKCKKSFPPNTSFLHVHHIIPISKGGTSEYSNLTTLCYNCHCSSHEHMQNNRAKKKNRVCTSKYNKPFN